MRTMLLAALLLLTACPADDAPDQADAGTIDDVDATPTSSLRACDSWDDCLGDPLPDGRRLDIGECCASGQYSGVCVRGRMTGGCVGGSPDCPYPGQPHAGVCMADTTALPLPAEQCEIRQPADELAFPTCSSDEDCVTYHDDGTLAFRGCCAVDVGQCVRGTSHDYYGRSAVCAVRTDFAAPEELCQ